MVKKFSTCVIFVLFYIITFSQTPKDSTINQESIIRLHLISPGICFESIIHINKTILFDFGTGFSFMRINENEIKDNYFKLIPYFLVEPRIYTNLKERKERGKRTDYFSGSYGAFKLQIGGSLSTEQWYAQLGPLVGFQRTLGKIGYWNIGIGVGSTIIDKDVNFGLIGDLKLGIILK